MSVVQYCTASKRDSQTYAKCARPFQTFKRHPQVLRATVPQQQGQQPSRQRTAAGVIPASWQDRPHRQTSTSRCNVKEARKPVRAGGHHDNKAPFYQLHLLSNHWYYQMKCKLTKSIDGIHMVSIASSWIAVHVLSMDGRPWAVHGRPTMVRPLAAVHTPSIRRP